MNRREIRKKLKQFGNDALTNYKRYYIGRDWRIFAEKYTKQKSLTEEQKRQIMERYAPYSKVTTVFHEYYTEKTGVFSVNYIPDDLYYNYIDRYYNDWDMATYYDNKCLYTSYFKNVRHPDTVAVRMNGLWFDSDMALLDTDALQNKLEHEAAVFIKIATESDGGHGVFYLENQDIGEKAMDILSRIHADVIIQRPVIQHEQLARFNEKSVNSIRVLTLLTQEGPRVYSCLLRAGVNGARVDNSSSGGVSCGIDEEGKLRKYSYTNFGDSFETHPGTDIVYLGTAVPGMDKVKDAALRLACQMPHFRLISWDFAVDREEEPVLIEANLKYGGMDFHQLNNGPLFGEDADRILNEVFGMQSAQNE